MLGRSLSAPRRAPGCCAAQTPAPAGRALTPGAKRALPGQGAPDEVGRAGVVVVMAGELGKARQVQVPHLVQRY